MALAPTIDIDDPAEEERRDRLAGLRGGSAATVCTNSGMKAMAPNSETPTRNTTTSDRAITGDVEQVERQDRFRGAPFDGHERAEQDDGRQHPDPDAAGVSSPSAMSSALMPVNSSAGTEPVDLHRRQSARRRIGEAMTAAAIRPNGRFRKNTHRHSGSR